MIILFDIIFAEQNLISEFSLSILCRWAFPFSHGGIPMHNFYLMKLLEKDLNISKISIRNETNYNFYKNNDLNYIPLKIPCENIVTSLNKYNVMRKNINLLKDWLVSRAMYIKIK